ncbi:MAG TPA: RIP metalloprotease RseP [Vicinamibacterales bacterium]|nr:RIP metalloprotease RseP [Vicinamibacterales bacterium]
MTTLVSFLFVLGVLIFVHELGHFLAARRLGVRVLTFSLGFGPKILKFTRGDTEYCVSAIPLGGYVKMAGESPDDPRSGAPDEFLSKSKWERFQILIMGPVMNIVLAVVVLAIVLAQGAEVPAYEDQPPVVGAVKMNSPAERVGIVVGDRILSVAGDAVPTWKDMAIAIGTRANRPVELTLDRGGRTMSLEVRPSAEGRYEIGDLGVLPDISPIAQKVEPPDAAARGGMKAGDVIYAVNGKRMIFPEDLKEAIASHPEEPIDVEVRRAGAPLHLSITPDRRPTGGWIGITIVEPTRSFKPGPFEAVRLSVVQNATSGVMIFKILGGLFTGSTSVRQLQGPVGIAQLSGESAEAGFIHLLSLMAVISLNLGLLNLMPVPVLDGGHILIMALEGVARRDFSMAVKEKMLLAGFVVLMMLMVTVIYNDLTRINWIERLMPWRN